MPLVVWNESLIINVQNMDFQHKHWIRLINKLHEAMLQGRGSEVVDQMLNEVLGYTRVHFASEERLLSESHYPAYHQHKKLHDQFIQKVLELKDRLEKGNTVLATQIMQEMMDWLTRHIQHTDQQYAPFLKQKGLA